MRQGNNSKRMFGRDITNLERRGKVHSITEKASLLSDTADTRKTSRSFEKRLQPDHRDAINDYEQDILQTMLMLQVLLL